MTAHGILLVNKPQGLTSRQVTNKVSKVLKQKKAGHLGTLDPIATGVLPVALGKATRLIRFLETGDKVYRGIIRLGQATDTRDVTGEITDEGEWRGLDPALISAGVSTFQGEIVQVPPMHSAVKKQGVPLYKLARKGVEVYRAPRRVFVYQAFAERIEPPRVSVRVRCSSGTYMRSIAHDLGKKLGTFAHLEALERLFNGPFSVEDAVSLEYLEREGAQKFLLPMTECLPHYPTIEITEPQYFMIKNGSEVKADRQVMPGRNYRLTRRGGLVAVAKAHASGADVVIKPLRVFE